MAVTDLTGYTWIGNTQINGSATGLYVINMTINGEAYSGLEITSKQQSISIISRSGPSKSITLYSSGRRAPGFTSLLITGGRDATNATLISRLQNWGRLVAPAGVQTTITYKGQTLSSVLEPTVPVPVTYNGGTITTVGSGETKTLNCAGKVAVTDIVVGSKTLNCAGKYMEDNVTVVGG